MQRWVELRAQHGLSLAEQLRPSTWNGRCPFREVIPPAHLRDQACHLVFVSRPDTSHWVGDFERKVERVGIRVALCGKDDSVGVLYPDRAGPYPRSGFFSAGSRLRSLDRRTRMLETKINLLRLSRLDATCRLSLQCQPSCLVRRTTELKLG